MKPLLLFFIISTCFSSCIEHQYLTLSGFNISKNDSNEFVTGNDTLELRYHFKDEKGRVNIAVTNRTGEPMVIDWWKSAIVIGSNVYCYYNPNAKFSGEIERDTTVINGLNRAGMSGVVQLSETSQFIPAHSQIKKDLFVFSLDTLRNLPEQAARKDTIKLSYTLSVPYRKMQFERNESPLSFRSYLTFRIGTADKEREFSMEHQFFVSEVWKIKGSWQDLPESITGRGDMIFLNP